MRIWTLHPKYLDAKGLVALWRETLLAKHVLEGKTKGYRNHPQLIRFMNTEKPLEYINSYLTAIFIEASSRGYNFDGNKIDRKIKPVRIYVTCGQVEYEVKHLLKKLKVRDRIFYKELLTVKKIKTHPIFKVKRGAIENWEILEEKDHNDYYPALPAGRDL